MHKALTVLAGLAIVLSVSGGAYAAGGLLTSADIKDGSLTGADIAPHSVGAGVLTALARKSLTRRDSRGEAGISGTAGTDGLDGATGRSGAAVRKAPPVRPVQRARPAQSVRPVRPAQSVRPVATGPTGVAGAVGATGVSGAIGMTGAIGATGANGTVAPVAATGGLTAIPTGASFVTTVSLTVPAGRYAILAKTQISATGAGDSVDCVLKAAATTLDQSSMKTLPALAATTVPLQAVTTVATSTLLSVQCNVEVANGSANFSSLIAIPTS